MVVACFQIRTVNHDNNHTMTLPRCRHSNGEPRLGKITGLQTITAVHVGQQMVMRPHHYRSAGNILTKWPFTRGSVAQCVRVFYHLAAKNRKIASCSLVILLPLTGRQAVDRMKDAAIHAQFLRRDQFAKFVQYKFIPSFFTDHTFFFGDTHVKNRGKEQAYFLSPMKERLCPRAAPGQPHRLQRRADRSDDDDLDRREPCFAQWRNHRPR